MLAVEALDYISSHHWASEKPKWGNEFVAVANEALAKIRKAERPSSQNPTNEPPGACL